MFSMELLDIINKNICVRKKLNNIITYKSLIYKLSIMFLQWPIHGH